MLKISKDGVSVIAVLDRRRAKKSGVFPVKIEVVYSRIQKYYPTGVDLPASEWKRISYSKRMPECHADIITKFNQISSEVEALLEKGAFSFEALEARMGKPVDRTLNAALELMMDKFQTEGRINSYYRCRTTLKSVERFAGKDILFSKLSVSWFNSFENFLKKENKAVTTISIYMKTLRCVMNAAAAAGLVKESMFPFGRGKYIIPKGSTRSLSPGFIGFSGHSTCVQAHDTITFCMTIATLELFLYLNMQVCGPSSSAILPKSCTVLSNVSNLLFFSPWVCAKQLPDTPIVTKMATMLASPLFITAKNLFPVFIFNSNNFLSLLMAPAFLPLWKVLSTIFYII